MEIPPTSPRISPTFSEYLIESHKTGFTDGLRFNGVGYHYYITRDGFIHPCRSEDVAGAHVRHYNAHSIGVCYEGGLDEKGSYADTRTPAQKRALNTVLTSLKADFPDALILGHRDLPQVHKNCPCFDARTEYKDI